MAASKAASELKIFAVVVNLLIMAVGVALVVVGVLVILDNHGMIQLNKIDSNGVYTNSTTPGLLDVATILCIVSGCLTFFMGLDGVFSVWKEWECMLALYIGGLCGVFLLNLATLAISIAFTYRMDDHLYNATYSAIRFQYEGHIITDNHFSKAFDEAQVQFECCGLDNYTDFKSYSLTWLDSDSLEIPKSCCVVDKGAYFNNDQYIFPYIDCGRIPNSTTAHLNKGCYTDIKDWLEENTYMLFGMSIVGAAVGILGVLTAICVIRDIGSSKKQGNGVTITHGKTNKTWSDYD